MAAGPIRRPQALAAPHFPLAVLLIGLGSPIHLIRNIWRP